MINVLIVEDTKVHQELLRFIIEERDDMRVAGVAANGKEAVEFMRANPQPDVILMDIHMPVMNGFEATRLIMEEWPTPVVIVSAVTQSTDVDGAFRAMEAGALTFLDKPTAPNEPNFKQRAGKIVKTLKAMAEVKVVRRRAGKSIVRKTAAEMAQSDPGNPSAPPLRDVRLVAIGASTGGPPVLQTIISILPDRFRCPVAIVQHITPGFLDGMVQWLIQSTGKDVRVAQDSERLLEGVIYFAPEGRHLGVDGGGRARLNDDPPEHGVRPAASCLFRSAAVAHRDYAIGALLTGMGADGAAELKMMRDAGAVTFAQDQESSVVHGMPGEAIKLGGATHVLPPEKIGERLGAMIAAR